MYDNQTRKGFASVLILIALLVVVASGVGIWFYLQKSSTQSSLSAVDTEPTGEVITIAKYNWPGTWWVEIADKKGWFNDEGLNVEIVDTNDDYYGSLQSVVDGDLDANNFPLYDFLSYVVNGENLVAVLNGDVSNGASGIVAQPEITSLEELIGKKVGLAEGTFSQYMFEYVVDQKGLSLDDFTIVNISTEDTISLLKGKTVDAVVSWEPLMYQATTELGANVIFDTSEVFGLDSSVWTFRKQFVDSRPGDVAAFTRVWAKTTEYMLSHQSEAFQIIADDYDSTLDDTTAYAALDTILSPEQANDRFSYSTGIDSVHGLLVGMNEFMIEKGLTNSLVRTESVFDPRFVNGL